MDRSVTGKDGMGTTSQKLKYHLRAGQKDGIERQIDFRALSFWPAWGNSMVESRGALALRKSDKRAQGPKRSKASLLVVFEEALIASSVAVGTWSEADCARKMMVRQSGKPHIRTAQFLQPSEQRLIRRPSEGPSQWAGPVRSLNFCESDQREPKGLKPAVPGTPSDYRQ